MDQEPILPLNGRADSAENGAAPGEANDIPAPRAGADTAADDTSLPVAAPAGTRGESLAPEPPPVIAPRHACRRVSRRRLLRYALGTAGCVAGAGGLAYYVARRAGEAAASEVFRGDAPQGRLWDDWKQRGWARPARHWVALGENIQCGLCPNRCILEPEDRGRCRNRVHKEGRLWTVAYADPCALHIDPIEKKPLFHFLPGASIFSLATAGCGFRCLNCQNWDISQRKPEETKDPRGEAVRLNPSRFGRLSLGDLDRLMALPEDIVELCAFYDCPAVAYTYSEPTVWFEYMVDCCRAARRAKLRNVWVTCGYIEPEPLEELCGAIDAANVDLKSFDEEVYRRLNSGKLRPILGTLLVLKQRGVWFEVTNLVVPRYTDQPEMIRRMCEWLVEHLGPDYPLHFSRFHPANRLTHLPPTPAEVLEEARAIARAAGLHYVYIGNCRELSDAETTFCPGCRKPVVERIGYVIGAMHLNGDRCAHCGAQIAGCWDRAAADSAGA